MAQRSLMAAAALTAALAVSPAMAEPSDLIGGLLGLPPVEKPQRPATRVAAPRPAASADVVTTGAVEPGRAAAAPSPIESSPAGEPAMVAPVVQPARASGPRPAVVEPETYPIDLLISLANDAVFTKDPYPKGRRSDPRMIKLQVLLDRNNASPGVIDGIPGDNVVKAVRAFEEMRGHEVDGVVDAEMWAALEAASAEPVLASYTLTAEDVAGPFVPTMPQDYAEQAALPGLSYRDAAEMLAERFHMDEAFLRRLNPDVTFAEAGVDVVVANVGKPLKTRVSSVVADKALKQIRGYDAAGKLVVAYPATIGSADLPSPTGLHAVKAIAIDPDYWYRPKVNFVQGSNTKALRLPPGPNGPVGATWVGLDKPTYGMHGTPEPSKIDKTNSHGCIRLTNWDARELAGLVVPGVTVDFQEPPAAAETPVAEAEPGLTVERRLGDPPRTLRAPAAEPLDERRGEAPVEEPAASAQQRLEPLPPPRAVPSAPKVRQSMR